MCVRITVAPLPLQLVVWSQPYVSAPEGPGFDSRWRQWDFLGPSHTSDLNMGTSVATLPGAWRDRVSAGTGGPGVSIL